MDLTKQAQDGYDGCSSPFILTSASMEKLIRFEPKQVPGKGWTVVRVEGSRRTGRTEHDIGMPDTYTLAQAQVCADSARRDHARHGTHA